jgi:replicative DNA helicase
LNEARVPPHSIEAEQSLLGALLLDNRAFESVGDVLVEADFYHDGHRRIWRHIVKLVNANRPADIVTVWESIESGGDAEHTGGNAYLATLAQNTPSALHARRYAEVVREHSVRRQLAQAGVEITESALNSKGREVAEILDQAESSVFRIAESGAQKNSGLIELRVLLGGVYERVDKLYSNPSPSDVTGVASGFVDLDHKTSGFQNGDLVIIAGRPSMGKTALALNVAEHVAGELGLFVAVFSMEMSGAQLAMRLLGSHSRVDQWKLRNGRLEDGEWGSLSASMASLNQLPIYIDEAGALTALEIRARARRLKRQAGKLGLVIVDYLQLMASTSENENRATEISEISRSLKALAKELECPVIALSQLNRAVDARPNKRPVMSDLRESGAIEQDADVILFVYRDEVYFPDEPGNKGRAEIIIGKQRNGPIGKVDLAFIGALTRFENLARYS